MSQAKTNASEAYRKATRAYESAKEYHNTTLDTVGNARELITYLTEAINNNTASPSEITALTEDTLKFELHLDPNEINNLAGKITTAVSHLENVDSIIASTRNDLERVQELKEDAESVK
jgi:laminin, beta 1